MSHVATLCCHPESPALDADVLEAVAAAVSGGAPTWLHPGVAADVAVPGDATGAEAAIRAVLGTRPVDVVVQPAATRRKRLFLADMDSTMIGQECIDELADLIGRKPEVAAITEAAMRGAIAFEPALRERVALLAGLPASVVAQVLDERITLTSGGRTLVATMRAAGVATVLVSGGFTAFTAVVAQRLGFEAHRANRLLVADDRFTGFVAEPILGREAKLETLEAWRRDLALAPADTLAVGDGANDLAMLGAAGLGVAFRAKPAVAAAAAARIEHADLTALLYIQGYRRTEFVDADA